MIIIGHRGARGLAPENTVASLKKALGCGVDEVEIDVRITKDGVPILSHDSSLALDGTSYSIASYTHAELVTYKPDLATLREALEVVAADSVLYIEVKHGEPIDPVVAEIRRYIETHRTPPAILLGSKSQKTLLALHAQLPEISKIVIEPWSGVRAAYRARQLGTKRISMRSWWLWRGFLRSMQHRGYQVVPYTMNNPQKVAKWQKYIYGVVTDYPDRFTQP